VTVPDAEASASRHLRHSNTALMLALMATVLLWNLPYGQYALYPFKIFATWLHESSHGVLMLITGAGFDHIQIYPDGSGLAYPRHEVTALAQAAISSAGYVGTAFFGALFLVLGRTPRRVRMVLVGLAAIMALTAVVWVQNAFGIAAVLLGAGTLAFIGWSAPPRVVTFLLNFIAAQACINAVLDIRVLFGASMLVNGQPARSDAHTMSAVIGGAPSLWATVWLLWSFLMFFFAMRLSRLAPKERKRLGRGIGDTLAP
jgi:hypothetical protein